MSGIRLNEQRLHSSHYHWGTVVFWRKMFTYMCNICPSFTGNNWPLARRKQIQRRLCGGEIEIWRRMRNWMRWWLKRREEIWNVRCIHQQPTSKGSTWRSGRRRRRSNLRVKWEWKEKTQLTSNNCTEHKNTSLNNKQQGNDDTNETQKREWKWCWRRQMPAVKKNMNVKNMKRAKTVRTNFHPKWWSKQKGKWRGKKHKKVRNEANGFREITFITRGEREDHLFDSI